MRPTASRLPAALSADGDLALRIVSLSKAFQGTVALENVSLDLRRGEIVGLLGHNGSGKSTLVKCLAGYYRPDALGEFILFGRRTASGILGGVPGGGQIGFVHQDLGLIPSLSVLDNFLITALRGIHRPYIDWRSVTRQVAGALERFGLDIPVSMPVAELSQADRCLIAVVRALNSLHGGAANDRDQILVLDEPTPFLPAEGVARLFALMRRFAGNGGSIIFIAHDVDEVLSVTDRLVVLRDGRNASEFQTAKAARDDVVSAIVGRALLFHHARREGPAADAARFRVENLSGVGLDDVSFHVTGGEILGVTGLVGSGAANLPELLTGARAAQSGTLSTPDEIVDLSHCSVPEQMQRGICLLPDDRLRKSGVAELSLADNLALPSLERFTRLGRLDNGAVGDHARSVVASSGVVPPHAQMKLGAFSGGNQQKALMAKWLALAPKLFVVSEPTQGVDVGSRQTIYAAIDVAAREGAAIVCYSSDSAELAQICDRVLILSRGQISAELSGAALTKDAVTKACLSATQPTCASSIPLETRH